MDEETNAKHTKPNQHSGERPGTTEYSALVLNAFGLEAKFLIYEMHLAWLRRLADYTVDAPNKRPNSFLWSVFKRDNMLGVECCGFGGLLVTLLVTTVPTVSPVLERRKFRSC